jgi:endonuclease/exonuclease/phosphatase family metal-dependent hydrolase
MLIMKQIIATAIACFFIFRLAAQDELNVMTFNIRYDNRGDSLNAWPYRKDKVASQIIFHNAHIVGVQEALHNQIEELKDRLPSYKYIGVGRNDGKQKGEYSAIFYDTNRIQILQSQTFWLAEQTNIVGQRGWDAALERIVTWAKMRDKKTKKSFYHFNTHFDHQGKIARRESAKLLLQKVKEIGKSANCIITGDFNAKPTDELIQVILNNTDADRLTDSKEISKQAHYGPTGTFNGFRAKEISDEPIDYIFIKNKVQVLQHATLSQTWGGRFSSDHFPVFARVRIQ